MSPRRLLGCRGAAGVAAPQQLSTAYHLDGDSPSVVAMAWQRPSSRPCFAAPLCFLFKASFGTFLRTKLGLLRAHLVALAQFQLSKTPLRWNKVVRLGLFWVLFWIQEHGFDLHQSFKIKFLFPFSLFITCLFLFLLFNLVDLIYIQSKCLVFKLISCLLLAFIHVRLDCLLQFILIFSYCKLRV